MIQNLRNRMEKTQETFIKDLEETKSKKTMMNNTINEIKNSLEGINSRITEAEEQKSDLEDKLVEITTAEQNKEKRQKRTEDSFRDLWDNINHTNIQIIGVSEEENRKGLRKYLMRLQWKTSLIWGRKQLIKSRIAESPIQDKSKEKHAKTHINRTIKN